jgi:hypothetical protein
MGRSGHVLSPPLPVAGGLAPASAAFGRDGDDDARALGGLRGRVLRLSLGAR